MRRKSSTKRLIFVLLLPLLVLIATSLSGRESDADDATIPAELPPSQASDHILVKFRPNTAGSEIARLHAAVNAAVQGVIPGIGVTRLIVAPDQASTAVSAYRASPLVEYAEMDGVMQTQFSPNDTYYATPYQTTSFGKITQWAPQFVSAPGAWDVTQGDPAVVIAVVDTGVDDQHPDLQGKIVGGTSYVGGSKDQHGHGTHVAGIAAAATNNSTGIAGICPRCSIMPVRALDANGSGSLSDVSGGIVYAADHGARVINLSLGWPTTSQTLRAAIDYAFAHNALPVAAMGNGYAADALEPAHWYSALAVGAVDQSGAKAPFSNYGTRTDVVAPGVAVLSTLPNYQTALTTKYKQGYDALSGTSMATPIVSGIAGLVLSRNPALTAGQVKGIIEATAGDGKSFNIMTGFGLVNAAKAVAAALPADTAPPSVNLVSPAAGSTVTKGFGLQAAPADNKGIHHVDFVMDGTRAGSPGTSGTSGGGGGKPGNSSPAWATQWESTRYWNGPQRVKAIAFDSSGNSAAQEVPFTISNSYATVVWSTHLCNPPKAACRYYINAPIAPQLPAAARVQVSWSYTRLDSYSNATFWASVFDGWRQQLMFTSGSSIDFFSDVRLCGCDKNRVGAGMAGTIRKNGGAEADVTVTVTYPQ